MASPPTQPSWKEKPEGTPESKFEPKLEAKPETKVESGLEQVPETKPESGTTPDHATDQGKTE
jgi:hypothetical protein